MAGGLNKRIADAATLALAAGHSVHHVSLTSDDWAATGLSPITLKPAPRAQASVLWAMDAKGWRLIPYELGA